MLSARRTSTGRPQAPATAFFISANLSPQGAILHRANLVGTNLIGANLTWANVAAANLSDAASAIQGSAGSVAREQAHATVLSDDNHPVAVLFYPMDPVQPRWGLLKLSTDATECCRRA